MSSIPSIFLSAVIAMISVSLSWATEGPSPEVDSKVSVTSFDGIELQGMWREPLHAHSAVLILQGSGNVGSDGDVSSPLLGYGYEGAQPKLSEQLAQTLSEKGIASLRYNKRGFGRPELLSQQTIPYLTNDAKAALSWIQAHHSFKKIGIVGFSEGALLAALVAVDIPVGSLYLLSLPTRSIDDALRYQFFDWPLELIRRKIDVNHDEKIDASEGLDALYLPFLGPELSPGRASAFTKTGDGVLSIESDLVPAYAGLWRQVKQLVETAAYSGWYHAMKELSGFETVARQTTASVHVYQGMDDAQVRWLDTLRDIELFRGSVSVRLYPGLGHCFAPMSGQYGESKTSGPFASVLLHDLSLDLMNEMGSPE